MSSRLQSAFRARSVALVALVALGSAGCTRIDNALASVPIFSFLRDAPFFDPYESPRPAPEGSVPFMAPNGVPDVAPQNSEAGLNAYGAGLSNPLQPSQQALQHGKVMYERHCLVCHGVGGEGNGPVIGQGKFPFASNLTLPITNGRSDGYLYGIVRVGRGLMPAYGSRTSDVDRWAIVHYLRQLQQQGAGMQSPQEAPTAGPTAAAQTPSPGRR